MSLLNAVPKPVSVSSKQDAPTDFDALADAIFQSVTAALDSRCRQLEQRIAVLEALDEKRSTTLSRFIRDVHGELVASAQERT